MLTLTIDSSKLNDRMLELHDALIGSGKPGDGDMAQIVKDEAKLLCKEIIRKIGPKSQAKGNKAVERDIRKSMKPFEPINEGTRTSARIQKLAKSADFDALNAIFVNIGKKVGHSPFKVVPFSPEIHRKAKDQNGRVKVGNRKLFVLPVSKFKKYVLEQRKRTGRAKAAFGVAYLALGGTLPNWITRHLPTPKQILVFNTKNTDRPSITIGSRAPGIEGYRELIQAAVDRRGRSIAARIRLALSGYSKDVANHIRVGRKFKPEPDSTPAIE